MKFDYYSFFINTYLSSLNIFAPNVVFGVAIPHSSVFILFHFSIMKQFNFIQFFCGPRIQTYYQNCSLPIGALYLKTMETYIPKQKSSYLPCPSIHLRDENLRNWRDIFVYALDSSYAISRGRGFDKFLRN